MHNNQILIGRNQIATSSHTTTPDFSHLLRKTLRQERVQKLIGTLRNAASYGLATLTVSGLLLGGTYLFLVQLAEFGW
ncbi:hypothetical protein [Desulfopila aestuarii]|uniref:Uncharacterized protein n=1 Tax=Desulfopila aestuarii DSM 18488 TaxID=1121416 RepID=A0A1M7Y6G6_9BACT|nr:hypothetical protein [Desulfopila aestuarii]SHO48229.1 hypothetical protein SAMN02745220_02206 [Desulfopila aestuarii DSM 18488]